MPDTSTDTSPAVSLAQRRAFVQLPLEERRRQLAAQAERMVECYESESARAEREAWQGGDIGEYQRLPEAG